MRSGLPGRDLAVSLPPGEGKCAWVIRSATGMSPCVMRRRAFSGRRRAPVAVLGDFPGRVELITQPVHTEHRDRGALRSTLQGSELMALIPIQLGSGQRWSGDFVFRATRR